MPLATLVHSSCGWVVWVQRWIGTNGVNVDEANAVAQVFLNTNMAAAGGAIAAAILTKILYGKADLSMALNGALAGLVSITAEPLAPSAELATVIGVIGGVIVVFSIVTLDKMKIVILSELFLCTGWQVYGDCLRFCSQLRCNDGCTVARDNQYLCVYVHCISL